MLDPNAQRFTYDCITGVISQFVGLMFFVYFNIFWIATGNFTQTCERSSPANFSMTFSRNGRRRQSAKVT